MAGSGGGYDLSGSASASTSASTAIGAVQFGNVSFNPVAKSKATTSSITIWIVAGCALLGFFIFMKYKR